MYNVQHNEKNKQDHWRISFVKYNTKMQEEYRD